MAFQGEGPGLGAPYSYWPAGGDFKHKTILMFQWLHEDVTSLWYTSNHEDPRLEESDRDQLADASYVFVNESMTVKVAAQFRNGSFSEPTEQRYQIAGAMPRLLLVVYHEFSELFPPFLTSATTHSACCQTHNTTTQTARMGTVFWSPSSMQRPIILANLRGWTSKCHRPHLLILPADFRKAILTASCIHLI